MSSKKRMYTFASGCENIPNENACNQAGGTHGYSCTWSNGSCKTSKENFTQPNNGGEVCSNAGYCMRWWNADETKEKFTKQTHDGEVCSDNGYCMRWWNAN